MSLIHSKHTADFDNRPVALALVRKVNLSPASSKNRNLWILRFYVRDENQQEKVLRSWFYNTDRKRRDDLRGIVRINPGIQVVQG